MCIPSPQPQRFHSVCLGLEGQNCLFTLVCVPGTPGQAQGSQFQEGGLVPKRTAVHMQSWCVLTTKISEFYS